MLNQPFEAIIFDCDGTLVDSEPITVRVLVDFVGEFGLTLNYQQAMELFVGRDMPAIVVYLESQLGKPLPAEFGDVFRQRQATALRTELEIIPGAKQMLQAMTKPYCLASNAPREKININLETSGLREFFSDELTFSAYDINVWKPQPDLFHYAANKMGFESTQCVVIEDSLAGIDAGIAAGSQVIGYSPSPSHAPTDKVPFVHSLMELVKMLA